MIFRMVMCGPDQQAQQAQGVRPWPFTPAGRPLWLPIGIPLRMSGRCYDPGSYVRIDTFYVKERFLFFTRWVAVQFQPDMLIHNPSNPSGPGAEPAKDLTCPPGVTT
jgi:hypothetical protein